MTEIPIEGDGQPIRTGLEVILHPTLGNQSLKLQQLVRYVEGLKAGAKPTQAAKDAGTTLGKMKQSGRAVQAYLARVRGEYTAEASDLKELIILNWTERALTATDSREAMAALHELSLIPEVGLKGKPNSTSQPEIRSFSQEAQAILDSIDDV